MSNPKEVTPFQAVVRTALVDTTQEAIAARAGVDRSNVSRWASGAGFPAASSLKQTAEALGVTLSTLVALIERSRSPR